MQNVSHAWGEPVWSFPIVITPCLLTDGARLDVAIVGAGFTGLATAHYLLQHAPGLQVAVFEAQQVGAGASGRTGGLVLEDTAIGPLPDVDNCVATLHELVSTQAIECDLQVDGCWEIGRRRAKATSPLQWTDHGTLRVVNVIPGGAFDPRKFLAGLARGIEQYGGQIFEQAAVTGLDMAQRGDVRLSVAGKTVRAARVVFATNAYCLSLLGLQDWAEDVHTVAVATEPLVDDIFDAIGWASRTPFYTLDLPYLWGRVTADGCMVIGGGLTARGNIAQGSINTPDAAHLFHTLEYRIRGLHPALHHVRLTHRWLGPLCFTADSKPIIAPMDAAGRVLVATGYRGHGVALSVRIGKLLAGVLAGHGDLPAWSYQPLSSSHC